ncbi:hypothetical protein ACHAPX_009031 [Trichoderma viride]
MSTLSRTLGNLRKVGIKDYFRQMLLSHFFSNSTSVRPPHLSQSLSNIPSNPSQTGDTKAGTLIGTDRAGNKFYENLEELPLRTRWVDFAKHDYDAGSIEPGWHAWISYSVDKPPTEDPLILAGTRHFEPALPKPNYTMTRGAFKTYNTTKPKINVWEPVVKDRV